MELLNDCSAALEAEKKKLAEMMMESLQQGEPAPQPVQERMGIVSKRLASLQEQMEAGELTMVRVSLLEPTDRSCCTTPAACRASIIK